MKISDVLFKKAKMYKFLSCKIVNCLNFGENDGSLSPKMHILYIFYNYIVVYHMSCMNMIYKIGLSPKNTLKIFCFPAVNSLLPLFGGRIQILKGDNILGNLNSVSVERT